MLAHYDKKTGSDQSLDVHLFNVANKAAEAAKEIGQQDVAFLCGFYHDLGKVDEKFQDKIIHQRQTHVDHSTAGAKYLKEKIQQVLKKQITDPRQNEYRGSFIETICYVIAAHHGVFDIPLKESADSLSTDILGKLYKRILHGLDETYHYDTQVLNFASELEAELQRENQITLEELILGAFDNYCLLWEKLKPQDKSEKDFYTSLIVRLYLSLLKNADILDTINAYTNIVEPMSSQKYDKLSAHYLDSIEQVYEGYQNPTTKINKIRTSIAKESKRRGSKDSAGVYRLNLPTGAGKTKLSMRYGFHQMNDQGRHRFIYIAPYLSILEQNAAEVKDVIGPEGEEGVLEHHSNVVDTEIKENVDGDERETTYKDYLIDTWDSPIVLSTMVQLFQTFFKVKSGNIRRFANLINSTIILDEVQSLPLEVTTLFNLTMNFLSQIMKVNVVLCTATQPVYDSSGIDHRIQYGGLSGEPADIVNLNDKQRQVFERTEVYKFNEDNEIASIEDVVDEVVEHEDDSILIILNTKAAVKDLYDLIKDRDLRQCYHLSTNMCAKHRLDIIEKIKREIKEEPLICISTQLIEAGVDLDFDRVIRSYAGIDSIVQASGRCNREGGKDKGIVQLVDVDNSQENLSYLKSIKDKKKVTKQIIEDLSSPVDIEQLNDEFFERYFVNSDKKDLDYSLRQEEPTVYDLLSTNEMNNVQHAALKQSFKEAGIKMDLIQDNSKGVIVYYDEEGSQLIKRLIEAIDQFEIEYEMDAVKTIKQLLKKLQPYTVNIRSSNQTQQAVMPYMDGEILILQQSFYDNEVGIIDNMNEFIL
nr:CRISPR-associated helicase Cas3' [Tetragenococcus halophilus]